MALAATASVAVATPAAVASATGYHAINAKHLNRSQHLTAAQVNRLAAHADQRVIILMKNQVTGLNPDLAHVGARIPATAAAEAPVLSQLRQLHAPNLHAYNLISAVAAKVSPAERSRLQSDPAVAHVYSDQQMHSTAAPASTASGSSADASAAAAKSSVPPGTCPKKGQKPLLPEYYKVMHVNAALKSVNGRGVKVGTFADGLDPNIPDFIRKNGKSAVFDYRDFSGEGTKAVTGGEEAFGDVSSIAAQGRHVYDLSKDVSPKVGLPANCDIRVKGVAPGASVGAYKWLGNNNVAFTSLILDSLDYAVSHDHVNVISESFGTTEEPTTGTNDVLSRFNTQAVRDGVTVLTSTGDAGTTNTQSSPSTAPGVIAVAGTTTYQIYAQTAGYGAKLADKHGWENNNVATLSSSGFNQHLGTVTLTAPSDGNWSDCSKDTSTFTECANLWKGAKDPQPIIPFGGTSESCPLTAGVAALVIEAYRDAHGGKSPTPEQVKAILTSSATDIHAAGEDQGSGLVNAKRAVDLARSIKGSGKSPKRHGSSLLLSKSQVAKTAKPGTGFSFKEKVTNTGAKAAKVAPKLTQFGAMHRVAKTTVHIKSLKNSKKSFYYLAQAGSQASSNYRVPYVETSFKVPAGQDRLLTRIAWNGGDPSKGPDVVRGTLEDPAGKMVANSRPQGANGGFDEIQDNSPKAGTYHLFLFPTSQPLYTGPVNIAAYTQKDQGVGKVKPAAATLKPGKSRTFKVSTKTGSKPGDQAQTLRFGSKAGTVPVVERSLVTPTTKKAGKFSSTITGGNARPALFGLTNAYQFDVPKGVKDIDINAQVAHSGYTLFGFLIDPKGVPLDVASVDNPASKKVGRAVHLTWANPAAGRWTFAAGITQGQQSGLTSTTLSGTVAFNAVNVTAKGLPSKSTQIAAGDTKTVTITVHNNGDQAKYFFLDPRTTKDATIEPYDFGPSGGTLPITNGEYADDGIPQFVVPPFSNKLQIVAQSGPASGSSSPAPQIQFDTSPYFGTPDVESSTGTTATVTESRSDIQSSEYSCGPTIYKKNGYGDSQAPSATYQCAAAVRTLAIDPNVTSSTGDFWADPGTWTPLVLKPHTTGTITATITGASDSSGTVESGYLPVVTLDESTVGTDVYKMFPYSYTVQ